MLSLLVITLAVTWAWETLRTGLGLVFPEGLPSRLTPILPVCVGLIGVGLAFPDWKLGIAASGASGLLRAALVRDETISVPWRR